MKWLVWIILASASIVWSAETPTEKHKEIMQWVAEEIPLDETKKITKDETPTPENKKEETSPQWTTGETPHERQKSVDLNAGVNEGNSAQQNELAQLRKTVETLTSALNAAIDQNNKLTAILTAQQSELDQQRKMVETLTSALNAAIDQNNKLTAQGETKKEAQDETKDETPAPEIKYWVTSSSGKVHNVSCRWFRNSTGFETAKPTGVNCKICGGAGKK